MRNLNRDYGSHLSVLESLRPIRRAIEFGAGENSTPWFLGLEELEDLVSVETDPAWAQRVATDDPRHRVTTVRESVVGFDVVLVDDGRSDGHPDGMRQRLETIAHVLQRPHPRVVIHDADVLEYRVRVALMRATPIVYPGRPPTMLIQPRSE